MLNEGRTTQLYDTAYEDQLYHRLFPSSPAQTTLPYVYLPVIAEAIQPLAELPYAWAFAVAPDRDVALPLRHPVPVRLGRREVY